MSDAARILRILGIVFALIGMVLLAATAILGARAAIASNGMLPALGEVVALQNNKPVVRFAISATQSVTIVGTIASQPPAYAVGEKLPIYFDPADPRHALIDTFAERWFFPTLFGALALPFFAIGVGFLIYVRRHARNISWLRKHGMKASGTIFDVVHNRYVNLNRKPTWQIVAQWSVGGVSHRTDSFHLMQDPRPLLGQRTRIDVWFDPRNPKRAWVDTDFLDPTHAIAQVANPVQRR